MEKDFVCQETSREETEPSVKEDLTALREPHQTQPDMETENEIEVLKDPGQEEKARNSLRAQMWAFGQQA